MQNYIYLGDRHKKHVHDLEQKHPRNRRRQGTVYSSTQSLHPQKIASHWFAKIDALADRNSKPRIIPKMRTKNQQLQLEGSDLLSLHNNQQVSFDFKACFEGVKTGLSGSQIQARTACPKRTFSNTRSISVHWHPESYDDI